MFKRSKSKCKRYRRIHEKGPEDGNEGFILIQKGVEEGESGSNLVKQ